MHSDIGKCDAQIKETEVAPELCSAQYVCKENEHVGQAQNCNLVEDLNSVATRVFQRPNTE